MRSYVERDIRKIEFDSHRNVNPKESLIRCDNENEQTNSEEEFRWPKRTQCDLPKELQFEIFPTRKCFIVVDLL